MKQPSPSPKRERWTEVGQQKPPPTLTSGFVCVAGMPAGHSAVDDDRRPRQQQVVGTESISIARQISSNDDDSTFKHLSCSPSIH